MDIPSSKEIFDNLVEFLISKKDILPNFNQSWSRFTTYFFAKYGVYYGFKVRFDARQMKNKKDEFYTKTKLDYIPVVSGSLLDIDLVWLSENPLEKSRFQESIIFLAMEHEESKEPETFHTGIDPQLDEIWKLAHVKAVIKILIYKSKNINPEKDLKLIGYEIGHSALKNEGERWIVIPIHHESVNNKVIFHCFEFDFQGNYKKVTEKSL